MKGNELLMIFKVESFQWRMPHLNSVMIQKKNINARVSHNSNNLTSNTRSATREFNVKKNNKNITSKTIATEVVNTTY